MEKTTDNFWEKLHKDMSEIILQQEIILTEPASRWNKRAMEVLKVACMWQNLAIRQMSKKIKDSGGILNKDINVSENGIILLEEML